MNTRASILKVAIQLFSRHGYEGVSMRNIADAVNISAAALYHHFKDKQSLYEAAITEFFETKYKLLLPTLNRQDKPIVRLQNFITQWSEVLHDDPDFRRLIQHELLNENNGRLQHLTEQLFSPLLESLMVLLRELKPEDDVYMLAVIIIGMIQKPYEMTPLNSYLSGSQPEHNDPAYISKHVMQILSCYLRES